jgi:hypothetical protein
MTEDEEEPDYISSAQARALLMQTMAKEFGVRLSTVEARYQSDPVFKRQVDDLATQVAISPPESQSIH